MPIDEHVLAVALLDRSASQSQDRFHALRGHAHHGHRVHTLVAHLVAHHRLQSDSLEHHLHKQCSQPNRLLISQLQF